MRRRSALLEALELIRDAGPDLTVVQIMAFLHVADEEFPLPLPDLQRRLGISGHFAWRTAQALAGDGDDADALVELYRWKMRPVTALCPSASGAQLRTALDEIIRRASPITPRNANRPIPGEPAGASS